MTNKEYLLSLDGPELFDVMCFLVNDYSRQDINSRQFMRCWFTWEHDPDDWAWNLLKKE